MGEDRQEGPYKTQYVLSCRRSLSFLPGRVAAHRTFRTSAGYFQSIPELHAWLELFHTHPELNWYATYDRIKIDPKSFRPTPFRPTSACFPPADQGRTWPPQAQTQEEG